MTNKKVDLCLGLILKHARTFLVGFSFLFFPMMPSGQDTQQDKNNMAQWIISIQKHILQTVSLLSAIQVH